MRSFLYQLWRFKIETDNILMFEKRERLDILR